MIEVLQELDKLKSGEGTKAYEARQGVHFLSSEVSTNIIELSYCLQ